MSNVIRFLESMGSSPVLANLTAEQYTAAVAALDVDQGQKQALLDHDHAALNRLLGGREKMYCSQYPAREDEPLSPQREPEPEPEPEPQDDDDGKDQPPSQKFSNH